MHTSRVRWRSTLENLWLLAHSMLRDGFELAPQTRLTLSEEIRRVVLLDDGVSISVAKMTTVIPDPATSRCYTVPASKRLTHAHGPWRIIYGLAARTPGVDIMVHQP